MNSPSDTNTEIIIDPIASQVTNPQSDIASIIQIDSYRTLAERITEISSQIKKIHEQEISREIHLCRKHQSIFINGRRGVGKTYFIVNLENGLTLVGRNNLLEEIKILAPIDISVFEEEGRILPAIIAHIIDETKGDSTDRDYHAIDSEIERLAISLDTESSDQGKYGIDTIMANIRRNRLEQNFHSFVREIYQICNNKIILLPIDDVDTSPRMAYTLAQLLRRYISSPYIVPIVSGDMESFGHAIHATIAQSEQYKLAHKSCIYPDNENKSTQRPKNKGQADQIKLLLEDACLSVIDKVFPANQRIQLSDFRSFNIADKFSFKLRVDNAHAQEQNTQKITINELSIVERKLFYPNFARGQFDLFHPWSYIANLRSFIAHLSITDRTWHLRRELENAEKGSYQYAELRSEIISQLRHYYRTTFSYSDNRAETHASKTGNSIEVLPRLRKEFITRGSMDSLRKIDDLLSLELKTKPKHGAADSIEGTISTEEGLRLLWRAVVKENDQAPIKKLFVLEARPDTTDKVLAAISPLLYPFWVETLDEDTNIFSPIALIPAIFTAQSGQIAMPVSVDATTAGLQLESTKDSKYECNLGVHFSIFEIYEIFNAAYKLWLSYSSVDFDLMSDAKKNNSSDKILIDLLWDALTIVLLAVDILEKSKQKSYGNAYNYMSKLHFLISSAAPNAAVSKAEIWDELLANGVAGSFLPIFTEQNFFSNICKMADKIVDSGRKKTSIKAYHFFSQSYYRYNPYSNIESVKNRINFVTISSLLEDNRPKYAREIMDWLARNAARKNEIRELLLSLPSYELNEMFTNEKWGLMQCRDTLINYDPDLLEKVKDFFALHNIWGW